MNKKTRYDLEKLFILLLVVITIVFFVARLDEDSGDKKSSSSKEVVYNSEQDASVHQVKNYLKANLLDPNSYESINWGYVDKVNKEDYTYVVRHKYRAKNSFGGYVIENKVFFLSNSVRIVYILDFTGE